MLEQIANDSLIDPFVDEKNSQFKWSIRKGISMLEYKQR